MKTILLLVVGIFLSTTLKSQAYTQTFESTSLTTLVTDSGWFSSNITEYSGGLLGGSKALQTPILSDPTKNVSLLTPYFKGNGTNTFSFSHRIQPSNTSFVKMFIQIFDNTNNLIKKDSIIYSGSNAQIKSIIFNFTGNYKIKFMWTGTGGSTTAYFDNFQVNAALIPLPVKLISFTAISNNNNNEVKWASSYDELGKYEIYRSMDGKNYYMIGEVDAHNNASALNTYSFIDKVVSELNSSMVYYKLKMVDNNGRFEWSNVTTIKSNSSIATSVTVYPNPTADFVNVTLNADIEAGQIHIIDAFGKTVHTEMNEMNNNVQFDVRSLQNGIYFIQISNNDGSTNSSKFIKR